MQTHRMPRHAATLAIGLLLTAGIAQAQRVDRYVWTNSPSPGAPYNAWSNAAHQIQQAVDVAVAANGDEVIVRAGVYDTGGRKRAESRWLTNRVVIATALTVRSEDNDPDNTIIMGYWHPGTTNGPTAVRGVYMVDGAKLIGFTVTNGATLAVNATTGPSRDQIGEDARGGGIFAASASVISNCVIAGNAAFGDERNALGGGGVARGILYDCDITYNVSEGAINSARGGGVCSAVLHRCRIIGNRATGLAGGVHNSTLHACTVSHNQGDSGGGARGSTLHGCTVANNRGREGGGVASSTVYDSLLLQNEATSVGGGSAQSTLHRSTIVSNTAVLRGAGVDFSTLYDCEVLYNWNDNHNEGVVRSGTAYNTIIRGNRGAGSIRSTLYNCLIVGNSYGGYWGPGVIYNCTIVGNANVGIYLKANDTLRGVFNTISWGNASLDHTDLNCATNSIGVIGPNNNYDDTASGNQSVDPQFVAMGSGFGLDHIPGNYRLRGTSPAVNAGLNMAWMQDVTTDLDGNHRIDRVTGQVDIGAYEYVYQATILLVR